MTANPNLPLALFFKDYLEDHADRSAYHVAHYTARYADHVAYYAHYTTANYADYADYAGYAARYALKAHAPPLIPLVYKALSL